MNVAAAARHAATGADSKIVLAQRRVNTALSLKRVPIAFDRPMLHSPLPR
jgi:hypothetical protein